MQKERDLGIDFHTNRFTVCTKNESQNLIETYELSDRERFYKKLNPTDTVTIEAMTGTFNFVREFKDKISAVNIVDPHRFPKNWRGNKTDKIDSRNLADAGYRDRNFPEYKLGKVYIPDQKLSELRSLFTGHHMKAKKMTMTRNRIHSILKDCLKPYNGKDIMNTSIRAEIMRLEIPESYKIEINCNYEELDLLERQKKEMEQAILGYGKYYEKDIRILISIPGVSMLIALGLKADYLDVSRFKNAKHFCSYLRTAPTIKASNEKSKNGSINKSSRKIGLTMLLQGIAHTWWHPGPIQDFRERKIKGKSNSKVRIAVARKIMVAMFHMLTNEELYHGMKESNYMKKIKEFEKYLKVA